MRKTMWMLAALAMAGCVAPQAAGNRGSGGDGVGAPPDDGGPTVDPPRDRLTLAVRDEGRFVTETIEVPGDSGDGSGDGSGGDDGNVFAERIELPGDSGGDTGELYEDVVDVPDEQDTGHIDRPCEPTVTPLYAGRSIDTGTVTVDTEDGALVVKVITTGDWWLEALHVYAGTGPVPTNPGGNVAPGSFPYPSTYAPAVQRAEVRIPLEEIAAACGETLVVAVHAEVARASGQYIVQRETGWAYGHPFTGRQWGWSFDATVCCPEDPYGCTYTQGYWKNHPHAWPVDRLSLGGREYLQHHLLAIFASPPRGDASLILGHQLIAAELNAATGATGRSDARLAREAAHGWLAHHAVSGIPGGTRASSAEGAIAVELAEALAAHNEGRLGTPHCDDPGWSEQVPY